MTERTTLHVIQFIAPETPEGAIRRIIWCNNLAVEVAPQGALFTLRERLHLDIDSPYVDLTWLDVHVRVNEYKRLIRRFALRCEECGRKTEHKLDCSRR